MLNQERLGTVVLVVVLLAALAGCKGGAELETVPAAPAPAAGEAREPADRPTPRPEREEVTEGFPTEPPVERREVALSVEELNRRGVLRTVYFGFDRSDLTPESQRILRENANWLQANPARRVVVEGHCDERGTIEYNMALGQRRARAVREYLASLGVETGRMRLVSWGEERPADPGHDEAAWSRNRRAAFVIE